VKDIFVREGELVSKGQALALLENLDFLQLQQDFLETKSHVKYLEAEVNRQTSLQEDRINSSKTYSRLNPNTRHPTQGRKH
jgi:cobalt-zinc-cadmium efflux system membrane fusion protein